MSSSPPTGDPDNSAFSLANVGEILFGCLNAIGARSLVEVGAYQGSLTRELLAWADEAGASVTAIEPDPPEELLELIAERPDLEVVREASHDALARIDLPDAVIIDGDHNYFTVSEELRLIGERAQGPELPLLMFHDVCWPHARRDTYYVPDRIPPEHRQPLAEGAYVEPGVPGVSKGGIYYEWAAEREGGPKNGVLTAIEDFVEGREGLRLAVVPAFFGFGVLWHRDAPWAAAVASIVDRWDCDPLLARMEENRVDHLVSRCKHAKELEGMGQEMERMGHELDGTKAQLEEVSAGYAQQEYLLRLLLDSRSYALSRRLSRLRGRRRQEFLDEAVRRALGESREDGP